MLTAAHLFAGRFEEGSRKQETRDCKGVKILLVMSLQPQQRGPPTLTGGLLESETELRGLSAEFIFHCPGFKHHGPSPALGFLHALLLPGASLSWAPAALDLFCAEVVSARLNPSHGTIDVRRVYAPQFFVSSQQKFGVTDIKAPSAGHSSWVLDRLCYSAQVSNGPCYSSLINQCYSSILFR